MGGRSIGKDECKDELVGRETKDIEMMVHNEGAIWAKICNIELYDTHVNYVVGD